MKPQYKKVDAWWRKNRSTHYVHAYSGYHRDIRTWSEARQNHYAIADLRDEYEFDYKIRKSRNLHDLDPWNDYPIRRNYGRSWKDYTKNHKQWMETAKVKTPKPERKSMLFRGLMNALEEVRAYYGE